MSLFSDLKPPASMELFVIHEMFMVDTFDKKVGLGAGGKSVFPYYFFVSF